MNFTIFSDPSAAYAKATSRLLYAAAVFLALPLLSGCAARLNPTLAVPEIPPLVTSGRMAGDSAHVIMVEQFGDGRESQDIVKRGEDSAKPANEIAPVVSRALQQALRNKGFTIADSAPVVLNGEVREWLANVKKGFPGKVDASAKVFIEVLDPANKRIYSGTYQGSASREDPSVDEKEIRGVLGTAMAEALNQVLLDKQLVDLLMSY